MKRALFCLLVACGALVVACGTLVLNYDGAGVASWKKISTAKIPNPLDFNTVVTVGKGRAYLALDEYLLRWDGKRFKQVHYPGRREIRNFVKNSEADIWAFGDDGLSLHFDGKSWKRIRNPLTGLGRLKGRLWGSGCASPDLCFAGSRHGKLIRWDGQRWEEFPSPAPGRRIYAMDFLSETDGWMAGDGFFARWDGRTWRGQNSAAWIYDLDLIDASLGWAVGKDGAFFKYTSRSFTKVEVAHSDTTMRSISCTTRQNCWAVGDGGAAFRWNGANWQKVDLGTKRRLNHVTLGIGHGLIAGDDALILSFIE